MSLIAIRDKIKSELEDIADIGLVYDYERWAALPDRFIALFKTGGKIKAWAITRTSTREEMFSSNENRRIYIFTIRGFFSLDDANASEKTFQDLIELICSTFRTLPDLEKVCENCEPVQVVSVGHAMLADVLCHFAELTLEATEHVSRS